MKLLDTKWKSPEHLKQYIPFPDIIKQYYKGYVLLHKDIVFHIYDPYNRKIEKIKEMVMKLYHIYDIVKRNYNPSMKVPAVYLILSPKRKYITDAPLTTPSQMINSAYTITKTKEIVVYRNQELELRFIHELVHAADLEHKCFEKIYPKMKKSKYTNNKLVSSEACTEYITMKLYFTIMNIEPKKQISILKERVKLFKLISSISSDEGRSLFLRYHVIPTMMLIMENKGLPIREGEIIKDVERLMDEPKRLIGMKYFKFSDKGV